MGVKLLRGEPLVSTAQHGPVAREAVKPFDLDIGSPKEFRPYIKPFLSDFQIGLIVGGSGTGKSTLLKFFGEEEKIEWTQYCVADHFDSPEQAAEALAAAGLNSVPAWLLRHDELSTGQKFRADLARRIKSDAVIDEFTSVVDRNVAVSASRSVGRYIRNRNLTNIVFSTCHRDIIKWLCPDWIIDTDAGELFVGEIEPVTWHKEFLGEPVGKISVS